MSGGWAQLLTGGLWRSGSGAASILALRISATAAPADCAKPGWAANIGAKGIRSSKCFDRHDFIGLMLPALCGAGAFLTTIPFGLEYLKAAENLPERSKSRAR